jgi:hypothetical protein
MLTSVVTAQHASQAAFSYFRPHRFSPAAFLASDVLSGKLPLAE